MVQLDSPTSISAFAVEDHLAVRDQRPGTTGKWLCSRDILILNAQLDNSRTSPHLTFPVESKSTSILKLLLDCQYLIHFLYLPKHTRLYYLYILKWATRKKKTSERLIRKKSKHKKISSSNKKKPIKKGLNLWLNFCAQKN